MPLYGYKTNTNMCHRGGVEPVNQDDDMQITDGFSTPTAPRKRPRDGKHTQLSMLYDAPISPRHTLP